MSPRALLVHTVTLVTLVCIGIEIVSETLAGHGFENLPFLILLLVTLGVGWLLAWRRRPLGRLILAIPALFVSTVPATLLAQAVRPVAPGVSVWLDWYTGVGDDDGSSWAWLPPVWILLCQLPLRFPDGRLPSPRWRWFSWAATAVMVYVALLIGTAARTLAPGEPNPAYLPWAGGTDSSNQHGLWGDGIAPALEALGFGLLALSCVVSIVSLFVRYRRGTVVARAQLRWMLWGLSLAVAGLVVNWFLPNGFELIETWGLLLYALIPISIAIAVLRYRLYEIDRIISRTAAYAIVTIAVVGPYIAAVLLVSLLPLSSVGVALATLIAAAVFLPLLRVVRRAVDRVFNRAQYDAEEVVDAFGERIRTGADPHSAGEELVTAVRAALQPAAVGIWRKEDA